MKKIFYICLLPILAFCDLQIQIVNERDLPYEFSPNKYENSEMKYENTLMKYENSEMKYENSEMKYENSSMNYKNSANGKRRLIWENYFVGYYVMASHGVLNFFSPKGKRLFYLPKNAVAVFDSDNGKFSGVLAMGRNRQYNLYLTEYGFRHLQLNQ